MKKFACSLILLLAGLILCPGCAQPQAPPATPPPTTAASATPVSTPLPDTIRVIPNPAYGQILADANGRTLYYFTKDTPFSEKSVCTLGCPGAWPPFNAATVKVSPPLRASDFGTITRGDGSKQSTYLGWPLYYYAFDTAPGDTKGYGVNGFWFVMGPGGVVTTLPTATVATATPVSSGGGH
jgi:predicted lipoprotein with Yx(FWY)xxD motif